MTAPPIKVEVEAATTLAPEQVFARLADLPAATRSEPRLRQADWDPRFAVGATARLRTAIRRASGRYAAPSLRRVLNSFLYQAAQELR